MGLSKAFDTLNHYLLAAKLKAGGLNLNTASNRYQSCEIRDSFSE